VNVVQPAPWQRSTRYPVTADIIGPRPSRKVDLLLLIAVDRQARRSGRRDRVGGSALAVFEYALTLLCVSVARKR